MTYFLSDDLEDDPTLFAAEDLNGVAFWINWDGAEGIGFWVGDPEGNSQPLSVETSERMIRWMLRWARGGEDKIDGVELEVPVEPDIPYLDHN